MDILLDENRTEYTYDGRQVINRIKKHKFDIYSENKEAIRLIKTYSSVLLNSVSEEVMIEDIKKLKNGSVFKEKEYSDTYYRLGLSTENQTNVIVKEINGNKSNLVRLKKRVSYYVLPLWRIDLTTVYEGYGIRQAVNSMEKYEIEIEYIGSKNGIQPNIEEFLYSINKLMSEVFINLNNC